MTDANIAGVGKTYQLALQIVQKRREQWDERVKDVIRNTLNSCILISRLPMAVDTPVQYRNYESVMAYFPDSDKIFTHPAQENRKVVQRGAQLIFQQLKSGNIAPIFFMPTIDGLGQSVEVVKDDFDEHEPDTLTSDRIEEYFLDFVDAVTKWELSGRH